MRFANRDVMPHSALIYRDERPLPMAPDTPALPRAVTTHVAEGLARGETDVVEFNADRVGSYLLICGVPGHGPGGMYLRFVVAEGIAAPTYR
jgi:sulfocyanin SoxE-like protein